MLLSKISCVLVFGAAYLMLLVPLGKGQLSTGARVPRVPSIALAWFGAAADSYLGVGAAQVDPGRVALTWIDDDSPADRAGLQAGDVVLEYGGEKIEGVDQFGRLVRDTPAGRRIKLLISRNGVKTKIAVVIGSRKPIVIRGPADLNTAFPNMDIPAMPGISAASMMSGYGGGPWMSGSLGVEIEPLGPQLAEFFGVKDGVLVRSVLPKSAASESGIRAGDVILRIGAMAIRTPDDVTAAIRSRSKDKIPMLVMRDRHQIRISLGMDDNRKTESIPAVSQSVKSQ